jgi:hypothetical protein
MAAALVPVPDPSMAIRFGKVVFMLQIFMLQLAVKGLANVRLPHASSLCALHNR